MFKDITPEMDAQMRWLEARDSEDRQDGTPHLQRLRQIPRETGRFLAIISAGSPNGNIIEIGTSAGYSTLWLALAGMETARKVTTFEISDEKAKLARQTFRLAGVEKIVDFHHANALETLKDRKSIAFCFLDAEKRDYLDYYELVIPRLVPGGFLVADNAISHTDMLGEFLDRAENDSRVDCIVVPVGKGLLLCRRYSKDD